MIIEQMYQKLSGFEYISFDMFDTLLKRGVSKSDEVYNLIEVIYNKHSDSKLKNYKKERILSERRTRKKSIEEDVTLAEIYSNMNYEYELRKKLYDLECQIEICNCFPNKPIVELYNKCLENNKYLIITTDMYLPRNIIEKILCKIGVSGYKKLYISSEQRLTKRSGNLYQYILKDLNITGRCLIHIGDNREIDVNVAQKYDIASCLVKEKINKGIYWKSDKKNIALSHMKACLENVDCRNKTTQYMIGFQLLGAFLFQFSTWLHNEDKKQKFSKIVFLAREGYLPYLIYKQMYPEDVDRVYYMRLNKNSLRLPLLKHNSSIENFVSLIQPNRVYLIKQLCEFLMLDVNEASCKMVIEKHGYGVESKIAVDEMLRSKQFAGFYCDCLILAKHNMDRQYSLLCRYFEQNDIDGNVALVNNSMHGSVQTYLQKLFCDRRFWGIYFILTREGREKIRGRCSIWFAQDCSQFTKRLFCRNSLLFEHLLFEDSGTTKYYDIINGVVEGICEQNIEVEANSFAMQEFRTGARDFVELYKNVIPMYVGNKANMNAIGTFINKPIKSDAISVGALFDYDYDGIGQLASEEYAKHTKVNRFFKQQKYSWKQGLFTIIDKKWLLKLYQFYLYIYVGKERFV